MTISRETLELARLKELLHYDPESGIFTWIKSNSNTSPVGTIAGRGINPEGYRQIQIDGHSFKAHRLAWFYVYGKWPEQIDHLNGVRDDNRIINLRDATPQINSQNQRGAIKNNKSGFLGVFPHKNGGFVAKIKVDKKNKYLGRFATAEEAHAVYVLAKRQFHVGCTL